jgi:hypothetical protein
MMPPAPYAPAVVCEFALPPLVGSSAPPKARDEAVPAESVDQSDWSDAVRRW